MFDFLIVGAGPSGITIAERLANKGKKCLILDRRAHIGGNCFDYYDAHGVIIHKYGPHYFRTNFKDIFDYLSQFTEWIYPFYQVKAFVNGTLYPFPINLDTLNQYFSLNLDEENMVRYIENLSSPYKNKEIKNSEDIVISKVGPKIFNDFYKNYTKKQWGLEPKELDPSVCGRINIRFNQDHRYFDAKYQVYPKYGYTNMFQKMLASGEKNIKIMLQTDFKEIENEIKYDKLIYTGRIDEFFDYKLGELPYRSLHFEFETYDTDYFQECLQINYPNDFDFTRTVEIKHITKQKIPYTTISREYPTAHGDPFYPIPTEKNHLLYLEYKKLAQELKNIYFIGRLAEYKYLNIDEVILNALKLSETL